MIKCRVKNLSGREVLAENLSLPNGQIVMRQGTSLKTEYIESLMELGIENLQVTNPCWSGFKPTYCMKYDQFQYFIYELKKILEQHIYKKNEPLKKVQKLAKELVLILKQSDICTAIDIYNRDCDLYEHLLGTTVLSVLVGMRLGLQGDRLDDLAFGCMIHDLGLRYINVSFSNCEYDKMDPKEIFELKNHTILGYTSVESEEWMPKIVKKLLLSHHEKLDGTGYPLKQKNKETECAIIQLCDTFDAMMSGIERKVQPINLCLEEITNNKVKYKKEVADVFLNMVARYPVGTIFESNERIGIVISQTENPMCPNIMFLDDKSKSYNLNDNPEINLKLL